MSTWTVTGRPFHPAVETHGREVIEASALDLLRKKAARHGEQIGPVTREWWEDGMLRYSATGTPAVPDEAVEDLRT